MANNLRLFKNSIYGLKRDFGLPVVFYRPITNEYDVLTGEVTRTFESKNVRRAIVLPTTKIEFFTYTLAYIVANKNFTYGANYDRTRRNMIVDARDLKDFTLDLTCYCQFQDERYNVEEHRLIEDNRAHMIKLLRTGADD